MKKFIPIASLVMSSVFIQNCAERDEKITPTDKTVLISPEKDDHSMSKDSAKSADGHLYPDPPVRDGDNWRTVTKKHNP